MQNNIENGDFRTFLEENENTYNLTTEELKIIMAFCNTCEKFNFGEEIALGPYLGQMSCIFKLESRDWITWDRDERCGFYNAKKFNNVEEACNFIILNNTEDNKVLEYFNSLIQKDITEEEINNFIYGTGFSHIKEKAL